MAAGRAEKLRTNIIIERELWGKLKARAFDERTSASQLIERLVRGYLKGGGRR